MTTLMSCSTRRTARPNFFLRESDELHELDFFRRVHSGSGFIEQKKLWPGSERPHNLETPLVAVRQRAAGKVALRGQAKDFQELDDAGLDFAFLAGESARAQKRMGYAVPEVHVAGGAHVVENAK